MYRITQINQNIYKKRKQNEKKIGEDNNDKVSTEVNIYIGREMQNS